MGKVKIFPRTSRNMPYPKNEYTTSTDVTLMFQNKPEYAQQMKLFQVIREGTVSQLEQLVETNSNINGLLNLKDGIGISALQLTARFNKPEAAEVLLKHGADPNLISPRGTALLAACRFNSKKIVQLLLKYGADPFIGSSGEGNVLHVIAQYSTVEIAELMFKSKKPPVNFQSDVGRTPLHNAAQNGNEEMFKWLLRHGADPKARCSRQSTPFMLACKHGQVNIMRILILAEKSSLNSPKHTLNEVDDEGNTPLHYSVMDNKIESVQELLQIGCNPNTQNVYSLAPLHLCAVDGYIALVALLSNYFANLEIRDSKGKTALHKAVEHNKQDVVETLLKLLGGEIEETFECGNVKTILLGTGRISDELSQSLSLSHLNTSHVFFTSDQGAYIDSEDKKQLTPLLSACKRGNVDLVTLLLKYGADVTRRNDLNQTCLHVAIVEGHFDVLKTLLPQCNESVVSNVDLFDQNILHYAARLKDIKFMNLLLEKGCSPDEFDAFYEIPLHLAARKGSYETVKRLLGVTKDVNVNNFENKSSFFCACELNNGEAIRALIEAGANVKDTDQRLRNTVTVAAMHGYTDIVLELINMGVSLSSRDEERNTALHLACNNGHVSTVKVLLDNNASVTATNIYGKSPMDMAIDNCKTDVVLAMIEHTSWEESLSVRDKTGATCMDRMIANTPEAVKAVLDKCVIKSKHESTHEQYTIEFNYKYIDPGPRDPMSKKTNYNALLTMVKHEKEDLLSHDLCQSLLVFKWKRFGQVTFVVDSFLQIGFLMLLIVYYFIMNKPNDVDYTCRAVINISNSTDSMWTYQGRPPYRFYFLYILLFSVYAFSLALFLREIKNAILLGCRYLKTCTFWMTIISVAVINYCMSPPGLEPCDDEWRLFAYGTVVFIIRESLLVQRFASIGLYFSMFIEVCSTMMKVFFLMLLFAIALTIPFSLMMKQDGFRNPLQTLLSILSMTVGELNFRDNFIKGDNYPFNADLYLLFPFFCIIMNLSLMNLMIGAAVGDISKVERRAYLTRLKTQIRYLVDAEVMPFMRLRDFMHTDRVTVMPNVKPTSLMEKLCRKYVSGEQILYMKKKMKSAFPLDESVDMKHELKLHRKQIAELNRLSTRTLDAINHLTNYLQARDSVEYIS